jgi:hypothetical protein
MHITAYCFDCFKRHDYEPRADGFATAISEWREKHKRCVHAGFIPGLGSSPTKEQLEQAIESFGHNADIKTTYASSADFTITLASLATDSNLLAGRESTSVDNTSNKYVDYLVGGKITTGTSPTASKQIEVYAYGSWDDSPTYPDVFDGTDSNETITSADIKQGAINLLAVLPTNNTSDRSYYLRATSIAQAFGGVVPKFFGLFVVHNTGVNFNSTGGNHDLSHTGIYYTSS